MEEFLFSDMEESHVKVNRPKVAGGSQNPIVFRDYESFISKFTEKPKTTDECWTPQDVYEAVVRYVGEIVDLTGKEILRPFYPGGDYVNAEYPENGVVIDNPPFSIFTKICRFYSGANVPFFLFGPGLSISSCCRYCTAVIVADQIKFTNGAKVKCNFATNLMGDTLITTAVNLTRYISQCLSQDDKVHLPSYVYPEEVLSISDFQTIAKGNEDFSLTRSDAIIIKSLDLHPKKGGLFGDHFLAKKAAAKKAIHLELSAREQRLVEELDQNVLDSAH